MCLLYVCRWTRVRRGSSLVQASTTVPPPSITSQQTALLSALCPWKRRGRYKTSLGYPATCSSLYSVSQPASQPASQPSVGHVLLTDACLPAWVPCSCLRVARSGQTVSCPPWGQCSITSASRYSTTAQAIGTRSSGPIPAATLRSVVSETCLATSVR